MKNTINNVKLITALVAFIALSITAVPSSASAEMVLGDDNVNHVERLQFVQPVGNLADENPAPVNFTRGDVNPGTQIPSGVIDSNQNTNTGSENNTQTEVKKKKRRSGGHMTVRKPVAVVENTPVIAANLPMIEVAAPVAAVAASRPVATITVAPAPAKSVEASVTPVVTPNTTVATENANQNSNLGASASQSFGSRFVNFFTNLWSCVFGSECK